MFSISFYRLHNLFENIKKENWNFFRFFPKQLSQYSYNIKHFGCAPVYSHATFLKPFESDNTFLTILRFCIFSFVIPLRGLCQPPTVLFVLDIAILHVNESFTNIFLFRRTIWPWVYLAGWRLLGVSWSCCCQKHTTGPCHRRSMTSRKSRKLHQSWPSRPW